MSSPKKSEGDQWDVSVDLFISRKSVCDKHLKPIGLLFAVFVHKPGRQRVTESESESESIKKSSKKTDNRESKKKKYKEYKSKVTQNKQNIFRLRRH